MCFLAVAGLRGAGGWSVNGFPGPQGDSAEAWPGRQEAGPGRCSQVFVPCGQGVRGSASRGPRCRGSALAVALPHSRKPGPCGQRDTQTNGWTHRQLVAAEAAENGRKPGRAGGGQPRGSWKSSLPVFPTKGLCPPRKATGQPRRLAFSAFSINRVVFLFCSWHSNSTPHAPSPAGHHSLEVPRASGGQKVSGACPGAASPALGSPRARESEWAGLC